MKPLYENFNDKNKETLFNLQVYDVINKIEKHAQEWFVESYIDVKDYIPQDILTSNLKDNLDYLFTEAIWWIELGESFGYNIDSKRFVKTLYDDYTSCEDGYKNIVRDERFCRHENRVYSENEIKENNNRMNEIMCKIIADIN